MRIARRPAALRRHLPAARVRGAAASRTADDGDLEVAAAFYPLAVRRRAGRRRARDVEQPDRARRRAARPRADHQGDRARSRGADLVVYERGFQPAVDEAVDETAEGVALDAADVVDLLDGHEDTRRRTPSSGEDARARRRPRPALLARPAADGRPRRRGRRRAGRHRPRPRRRLPRQRRRPARPTWSASTASTPTGWPTASGTRSWSATTRSATWSRYGLHFEPIAGLSPDAEPTPADLGRAAGADRGRGHHHGVLRDARQPEDGRARCADDLGLRTAGARPDRGPRPTSTADEDYLSLMRRNLAALQEANGC